MQDNFPQSALDVAKSHLSHLYTKFSGLGIVSYTLSQAQLAFVLLDNTNKFLESNPYYEVALYNLQKELPMMIPYCAIYGQHDIIFHEGSLVALDPNSWSASQTAISAKLYYYIYDVLLLKFMPPPEIERLRKSNTILFTRTKEHAKFLKKTFQLDTIDKYVLDLEIEGIKEIVEGTK